MQERLRDWLIDPAVRSLDVDSVDFSIAHRQLVVRKRILQQLFYAFYRRCRDLDNRYFGAEPGRTVEIGSGAGIMKDLFADTVTSDIKPLPFIDVVFRAERMPFRRNALRSIYAINVFHHFPDPRQFFRDLLTVVRPGGGAILVEPFHGPFAQWLFKRLHSSERYEMAAARWEPDDAVGPFSNANQALSYIVFERDHQMFEREFPDLEVVADEPHTHLWYLLSGGVNFRQLVPDSFTPAVRATERLLAPLDRWIALQHTIVLRKRT